MFMGQWLLYDVSWVDIAANMALEFGDALIV